MVKVVDVVDTGENPSGFTVVIESLRGGEESPHPVAFDTLETLYESM